MSDAKRQWTPLVAVRTVRPPAVWFVAIVAFILAVLVAVVAGLEDSSSSLDYWQRIWRWSAANLTAAIAITLALVLIRAFTPGRWYYDSPKVRALTLSYGGYLLAGVVGGLARFLISLVVDVPPVDASVTHHLARIGSIVSGMLLVGFLANQFLWFLDRIRAQQKALQARVEELARENQERRVAQAAALRVESRLLATLRTMAEGVLLVGPTGEIVLANKAAQEILGQPGQEVVGKRVAEVLQGVVNTPAADILAERPDGIPLRVETEQTPRRVLNLLATAIEGGPEVGGRVLLVRDVTEENAIRQRLERDQRMAALGQLAAGVAHDFNNLLTGVIGASEALRMSGDLPDEAKRLVQRINDGGVRAAHVVRQLLDFSRKSPAPMAAVDFSSLMIGLQDVLRHAIPENVHLNLDVGADRYIVRADASQLERAIMNLAVNAVEAMPEGGALRIRIASLRLGANESPPVSGMPPGQWVTLTVSDTGIGIPPDNLDKLYVPFFTTKSAVGGTGLGLAQVYGIVSQHKGYISVDSQLGKGTTFTVFLPALPETAALPLDRPDQEVPTGHGETVLLVEDDELVREVLEILLERLGYRLLIASNGRDALAVHQRHGQDIDVVLSDVTMPHMGGVELFRTLRQRDPDVRLIALTGYAFESEAQRFMELGMVEWLQKPPTVPALARAIRRALRERRPPGPLQASEGGEHSTTP